MENSSPKKASSGATDRTKISLASTASAVSYNSMVKKLPAHTAEGLIHTIFQDRAPEDENIKLVFIHELYLIQSIIKVTEADTGLIGNMRLVRRLHLMNRTAMDYLTEHHRLLRILDEGREEEEDPHLNNKRIWTSSECPDGVGNTVDE